MHCAKQRSTSRLTSLVPLMIAVSAHSASIASQSTPRALTLRGTLPSRRLRIGSREQRLLPRDLVSRQVLYNEFVVYTLPRISLVAEGVFKYHIRYLLSKT